jgi:Terminase RNaseH-like domain
MKIAIMAGWDDVPHLDEDTKKTLLLGYPPHMRDARTKGIPRMGAGAIYPVSEDDYKISPIALQPHWPRVGGLDVGWNTTACLWAALDRDSQQVYIYAEHYRGKAEVAVHASAIAARGAWIPLAIDPASRGRSQHDGRSVIEQYEAHGLNIHIADNAREAGIFRVWTMLSEGRLKIFSTCANLLAEMRIYRRDERGNIVKSHDHAVDALRYLCGSLDEAITEPNVEAGKRWCDWSPPPIWAG